MRRAISSTSSEIREYLAQRAAGHSRWFQRMAAALSMGASGLLIYFQNSSATAVLFYGWLGLSALLCAGVHICLERRRFALLAQERNTPTGTNLVLLGTVLSAVWCGALETNFGSSTPATGAVAVSMKAISTLLAGLSLAAVFAYFQQELSGRDPQFDDEFFDVVVEKKRLVHEWLGAHFELTFTSESMPGRRLVTWVDMSSEAPATASERQLALRATEGTHLRIQRVGPYILLNCLR